MKSLFEVASNLVDEDNKYTKKVQIPQYLPSAECPNIEELIDISKYGKFIACSNYPDCNYKANTPKPAPEPTGELCPECGNPLVKRVNFRGQNFVGCSNYPNCHYIKSDDSAPRRYYRGKKNAKGKS